MCIRDSNYTQHTGALMLPRIPKSSGTRAATMVFMLKTSGLWLLCATLAQFSYGALIEFQPPGVNGSIFSTNSNDGYQSGRGILFMVDAPTTINSVGVFQNLTNIPLSFSLEVFNGASLSTGGSTVTTSGLQWIDYNIAPVTLTSGIWYHLEFGFTGLSNQNFFYDNGNISWSQSGFTKLDGTQANSPDNFVVAAFRVNTGASSVPDGGTTVALLGITFLGITAVRRMLVRA